MVLFTGLWRWLPLRLSKRQSPTTVLFRTTLTQTITLYELLILLGSNHLQWAWCYTRQGATRVLTSSAAWKHKASAGAHHYKPGTAPYSRHGVFTDRSIFSFNSSRIQIPTGTPVTNCNHKHGLMSTCRNDVDMFTWGHIVLSSPKRAHVDWNWPISQEKYLKIDWSVKMPLHWLIMGVAGS